MKKSELKLLHANALFDISMYQHLISDLRDELQETQEALDRRRQLYKSMEALVNRSQPKSIEDMAKDLLHIISDGAYVGWNSLPQEEKDSIYDKLLKIIG